MIVVLLESLQLQAHSVKVWTLLEHAFALLCTGHKQIWYPGLRGTPLFFFNILFYILTLQYCIGFAIYQHESATGMLR